MPEKSNFNVELPSTEVCTALERYLNDVLGIPIARVYHVAAIPPHLNKFEIRGFLKEPNGNPT